MIWKVKPAGPLRGAPTIAFGGVYVISQDNQIFALNAANGEVQWQATASMEAGSVFGAASPAAGQGTIVAGFSSGEVQAYRYENGRDLWEDALARTSMALSVSTLTDVDADPVVDRGRVQRAAVSPSCPCPGCRRPRSWSASRLRASCDSAASRCARARR